MIKASVQFHFYSHTAEDERLEQHQLRKFKGTYQKPDQSEQKEQKAS